MIGTGGRHHLGMRGRLASESAAEEEQEIFPRLQAMLSDEQRKALTNRMNREGFKVA